VKGSKPSGGQENEKILNPRKTFYAYIGDLVLTREAAHPAVPSMGTWCLPSEAKADITFLT